MFSSIFHIILYQPIFNLFVFLYNILPAHDTGVAIFVLTVIIRLIVYPLTASSIKAQKSLQEMQPKLEEIKKQYKDEPQKQTQAMMELYKTHKINPASSCLPTLIQLPVLIALFWVLRDGLASNNLAANLYPFIHNPGTINPVSFGLLNLSQPSIVLALLAGVAQFFQAKMLTTRRPPKNAGEGAKDEDMAAIMNKQMLYVMPIMTAFIGMRFAAGLTLYWFLTTALMIAQQWYIARKTTTPPTSSVIEGEVVK